MLLEVTEDVVEGERCFLWDRTVTLDGMKELCKPFVCGSTFGGVVEGPGSLLRACWTRCSNRCICPISPRIWWSDREGGNGIAVLALPKDGPLELRVRGYFGRGVSAGSLAFDVVVEISDMGGDGGVGE